MTFTGGLDSTARAAVAAGTLRAAGIAARLGGQLEGPLDVVISGAAPLEAAGPDQIAFLARERSWAELHRSRAGCVLVARSTGPVHDRCLIRVDDPRLAFARVLSWLHPRSVGVGVHPTAIVHESARIGLNVAVGPWCVIGAGCVIGDETVLHARVTLYDRVVIGRRCEVHAGAVIGADGFGFAPASGGYEKVPQIGGVDIGDDVEIGANTTVDRGTLGATRIGAGTKVDNLVQIAHNCVVGRHVVIAAQTGIAGSSRIGDWARIGGQVGIGDRVRVDANATIGAASAVPTGKRIRAGETVWGVPARPLRQQLRCLATLGQLDRLRSELRELRRNRASRDGACPPASAQGSAAHATTPLSGGTTMTDHRTLCTEAQS